MLGYGTDAATDFDDGEPMDGRAAAKDERATRRTDGPDGTDNVTPIGAAGRRAEAPQQAELAPAPAPSRLPATRRGPTNGASQPEANGATATMAPLTRARHRTTARMSISTRNSARWRSMASISTRGCRRSRRAASRT